MVPVTSIGIMAGKFGKVGKFAIGGIFGEGSAALGTLAVVSLASMRFDWRSGVAGGSAGNYGLKASADDGIVPPIEAQPGG